MKKIALSSTLIAAGCVSAFLLLPGSANGATAKEAFHKMRSALAQAAKSGELTVAATLSGSAEPTFVITLDGNPLPPDVPMTTTSEKHADYTEYTVTIDLSDNSYSKIAFGPTANTLELTPKSKPDQKDIVRLDPKTSSPTEWSAFRLASGEWKKESTTKYTPSKPKASASKPTDDQTITIHMRVATGGGSATVSVKNTGG